MNNYTADMAAMKSRYEQLASSLGTGGSKAAQPDIELPAETKLQWATQEGFKPLYDPNSDGISWVQEPKPAYQAPELMNLQGSMSPEALQQNYPAFALKAQQIDPLLQDIIQKALDGDITHQHAQELCYQLAQETFKHAWADGKPKGAGKNAASFAEALNKASTKNALV